MNEEIIQEPMTVAEVVQEVQKEKKDFPLLWEQTKPVYIPTINGYVFKTKNLTKMLMFVQNTDFSLQDLAEYMDYQKYPLTRMTNEDYAYYRIRRSFQQYLLDYRKEVKAIIVQSAMTEKMKDIKAKQDEIEKDINKTTETKTTK